VMSSDSMKNATATSQGTKRLAVSLPRGAERLGGDSSGGVRRRRVGAEAGELVKVADTMNRKNSRGGRLRRPG